MSGGQILFVCHDAGGTVPPVLAVAQQLVELGERVSILSQPGVRPRAEAAGCTFFAFSHLDDYERHQPIEAQLSRSIPALTGTAVGDDLLATTDQVAADVVVVDPNLTGALAAAESAGHPSVVLLHSLYQTFVDTWFGELWPFLADPINATRRHFGRPDATSWASLLDGHDLVISPVPAVFDDPAVHRPGSMRSYGFLVPTAHAPQIAFPAGEDPAVLVSLSTTHQDQRKTLVAIVEALADLPVRGLVTTAGQIALDELSSPTNVIVTDFADHQSLLADAAVVVTHAGLGTTAAALSAGVPMVCTPLGRDQPLNARRAAALGAAIVVHDATPADLARAITDTLTRASYAEAARSIATAAAAEGGPGQAAIDILGLRR